MDFPNPYILGVTIGATFFIFSLIKNGISASKKGINIFKVLCPQWD
jgi:hypothetical protein